MAARAAANQPRPPSMTLRVLESQGHAVIVTDPQGVVTLWNRAAEQLYGWTAQEAVGRPVYDLTVPEATQELAVEIMRELTAGRAWSGVFNVRRKNGSSFPALVTDTALRDDNDHLIGIVGVSLDIVDVLLPFIQRTHEAVIVTDADGVIRLVSPVITALSGWEHDQLVGRSWWHYVHREDRHAARAAHGDAVAGREMVPPVEHRLRCADGSWLWVETAETSLLDEPAVRGVLLTLRDVSERRAWVAELTRRALHDELTGLVNRAVFMEHLESHVAQRRHAGAVLYLDLDRFKDVNDQLGHLAGDQVLREVAHRLRAAVRPEDICGRLGGDEFAVLAPTVTDQAQAASLVRRIRAAIARPVAIGSTQIHPAASIGLAMLTESDDADHAIRLADNNMYARKRTRAAAARRRAAAAVPRVIEPSDPHPPVRVPLQTGRRPADSSP